MLQKCDSEYDRFQIEQPLIEMVTKTITNYQIQDVSLIIGYQKVGSLLTSFVHQVICLKCSQTKSDNLAATCKCGGGFRTTSNRNELKTKLKMIKSGKCLRPIPVWLSG